MSDAELATRDAELKATRLADAARELCSLAVLEREFYTSRFEKGQQRGLVVLTSSAGFIALVSAGRALLPASVTISQWSILTVGLALLSFTGAAIVALFATGPAWSKTEDIPTATAAKGLSNDTDDLRRRQLEAGNAIFQQANGIRTKGNQQAQAVLWAIRMQSAAVVFLAVGALLTLPMEITLVP